MTKAREAEVDLQLDLLAEVVEIRGGEAIFTTKGLVLPRSCPLDSEQRWQHLSIPKHGPNPGDHLLETTQGQVDGFFSQRPFKCYLPGVASVGD